MRPARTLPTFLAGDAEMAARMRAFDWGRTPLGDPAGWAQPLKTLVALMLGSRQPMFMAWGEGRTWLYNDAFIPILGHKHPAALGRHALDEVWNEARATLVPLFDRVFAGEPVEMQDIEIHLDRRGCLEEAHFSFSYTPARDDDAGDVRGLFGACIETTDRVRAERARAAATESETRFQEIADAAPVMVWISDTTKACTWFNRPWLTFTGRRLDEHVGDGWMRDIHPDDLARCVAVYHAAFDRRERLRNDYRLRRSDGAWRVVEDMGVPRFSVAGEFLGYVGSCVDVTDRRAAEQALRRSEEQLRLATEAAEVGLWDVDPINDKLFWPARVKAMFGISPDVPVSMADFHAALHPDDREATCRAYAAANDPGTRALYDVEYRTIGKEDGRVRWVAAKGRGIFDDAGHCVRVIGTAIDITARKEAEAKLREREEHLRAVVETSPECVKIVARDGTLLQMNRSGLAMVGASHEGLAVGKSIYDLMAPEYRDAYRAFNERVCDGAHEVLEYDIIALDGKRRHMESHAAPLRMPDGSMAHLALTRDVTARREAEEALRRADRRKDDFIATLSHELRNPLAPLASALQVARMGDAPGTQAARMHELMERQLTHLVRLVDDLLEMSRIDHGALELHSERVDMATIVRNAVETSAPVIEACAHELALSMPAEDVWLEGDRVRLAQVLANLLDNAARFMGRGGSIDVVATADERWVEIAVRDRGSGFDPGAAAALFEMFGRGSGSTGLGIGLALARRLAEMHGGTIDATSDGPGKGAEFTLRLPRASAPESIEGDEPMDASIAGRRVLVVDDNRDAADSLRLMLELLGAEVRVAHNGRDAIEQFAACAPAAVLLDIGMPEMDGYEVARTIRQRFAGHPAIIVALTGWGQENDRRRSREAGFDHHLVKPADLRALERLLAQLPVQARSKNDQPESSVRYG